MMKIIEIELRKFVKLPIRIPRAVEVCPICDSDLVICDIDEWETETGKVTNSGLHFSCEKEPEFEEENDIDEFDSFTRGHYSMPYVDWLPLQAPVLAWFNKHYCIKAGDA